MKFTLNTLGAPNWDLEETARNAREYGYAGVDLRLLDGEVISLESVRANRGRLRALFPIHELPLAVLATSVRLATADPRLRLATLDEARAWIDLAAELDVPVIRYFAARNPPELDLEGSVEAVGEMLARLAEDAVAAGGHRMRLKGRSDSPAADGYDGGRCARDRRAGPRIVAQRDQPSGRLTSWPTSIRCPSGSRM